MKHLPIIGLCLLVSGCSSCKDDKKNDAKADAGRAAGSSSVAVVATGSPNTIIPKPPDDMLVLCPKCGKPYKASEIHIAPVWSEGLKKFVPSHRCEGHFKEEIAATRKKLETASEKEVESFVTMAKNRGNEEKVKKAAGDKKGREAALAVLDAIEKGDIELNF